MAMKKKRSRSGPYWSEGPAGDGSRHVPEEIYMSTPQGARLRRWLQENDPDSYREHLHGYRGGGRKPTKRKTKPKLKYKGFE